MSSKHRQNMLRVFTPELEEKNVRYLELRDTLKERVVKLFAKHCQDMLDMRLMTFEALLSLFKRLITSRTTPITR